jgi:Cft2 family RNA processing exonuclease/predicted  nucleic acid-binding Zn-ribbon protein
MSGTRDESQTFMSQDAGGLVSKWAMASDPRAFIPIAVLEAAVPSIFGPDEPTVANTPPQATQPLAIEMALAVSSHEKNCRHVPTPLRPFAGMREQALLTQGSLNRMRTAIWRDRDHEFVRDVCMGWLSAHNDEMMGWVPGSNSGVTFPDLLAAARLDPGRLSILASMLWCLGVDRQEDVSWAFRLVCSLIPDTSAETLSPPTAPEPDTRGESVLKRKLSDTQSRVDALSAQLQTLKEQNRKLRQEVRQSAGCAAEAEKERESLSLQLADSTPTIEKLAEQVRRLQEALRQESAALQAETRERASEKRLSGDLADRFEELSRDLAFAEEQRASLSSALNSARLEIKELQARIATTPSTDKQVMGYLVNEEQRIEADLLRVQGGDAEVVRQSKSRLKKLKNAFLDYRPGFRQPRPPVPRSAGPLRYYALGGAEEIGASAYVVELAGHRILVDAGIRVGKTRIAELGPDLSRLGAIDALILTHAHTDHVGWAPAVIRHLSEQGDFEIFATRETAELLPVMMKDSRKHYERMAATERVHERYVVGREPFADPYERSDIEGVERRLRPIPLGDPVPLRGDLRFSLYEAGHILGAASVLIEGDGRRVFVTGDFADFWQHSVRERQWPETATPVDLLMLESTYGSREHSDRSEERDRFIQEVFEVMERGGVALIACFALGRAQEVLTILAGAMRSGRTFPVWIDGMIQDINDVYRRFDRLALPADFKEVRTGGWTREEVIAEVRSQPAAIVSTSGMLTGGPMVEYAAGLLPDGRNRIFFCGYLDEESPGGMLRRLSDQNGARRVVKVEREDGSTTVIRVATPAGSFNLSAHADRRGLIEATSFLRPDHTVLVHGDEEARSFLRDDLTRAGHQVNSSSLEFALDDE